MVVVYAVLSAGTGATASPSSNRRYFLTLLEWNPRTFDVLEDLIRRRLSQRRGLLTHPTNNGL